MDAFETLTASYFDGRLTEREAAELAHVLDNDVEKGTRFVGEYEIDRLLVLCVNPADQSRIDAIITQIQREADPFVQSVFQRIQHQTSAPAESVQFWRNWVAQLFSRPGWALLAAACLGFLCCAWSLYFGIIAGKPRLELTENSSIDVVRNGVPTRAQHGFALRTGDALSLPGTNSAAISFAPEKTRITIRPGTELKLLTVSGAKRFVLNAGKIEASVARQRTFKPMVILTPQAEARVLGTHFTLEVDTNVSRLDVMEGKVGFKSASDGKKVNVTAGNHALAGPNVYLGALPATGHILREYWTNSPGELKRRITWESGLSAQPDGVEYLANFEAPPHKGDYFGERIRGYLHPPKTGDYIFWIAGNDWCQFRLSRDDQPAKRVSLAFAQSTNAREWTKDERQQQTSAITLYAGRKYYIDAVQECENDEHHLAVAWQGPDREREVIPGEFLSPFETKTKEKKGK